MPGGDGLFSQRLSVTEEGRQMTLTRKAIFDLLRRGRLPLAVTALLSGLHMDTAIAAPTVIQVTGLDTATAPSQQAETAYNLSVVGAQRIETITSNDETGEEPTFVFYTATDRTIFPGYSLLGWSFRVRTAQNPNPPFTHAAKLRPPAGTAALWGDPSITSNPGMPNVVLLASLAIPQVKFPGASIQGTVAGDCSPLGGACVARSTDGGQTFSIASCFADTRPLKVDTCTGSFVRTNGHFFDGSSVAITSSGSTFTGFAAFIDTDLNTESIWRMNDVTSSPPQPFVRDNGRLGSMGDTGDEADEGDLGPIGTHVRLRAHGADLWKMSRDGGDLKVNIHGRNAPFVLAATNVATDSGANPTVFFANDAQNRPVTVRTGPQFAFDVGFNEAGQEEMRFVYLASDSTGVFLQGGFCPIDLASSCKTPPEWRLPAGGSPVEFHPAIKFGLFDANSHRGTWKVTVQGKTSGNQVGVFESELVRLDLVPGSPTANPTTGLAATGDTTPQTPCPDLRISGTSSFGYWGDYDDMGFDPVSKTFTRAFSDSSAGCTLREQLTSRSLHVSAVEMQSSASNRVLVVNGTLVDLADFDFIGDEHLRNQPISLSFPVNPTKPTNSAPYEACVDDDVKVRIVFSATLEADQQTLSVCAQQGIREISSPGPSVCDKDVPISSPLCFDVPPGGSVSFDDGGSLCADDCNSDNHAIWNATLTNTP
jgi:hypothetical protein